MLVWKTNNHLDECINSCVYSIKGTIKEHKEFNGIRQTILTRCKLFCLIPNEIGNKELIYPESDKALDKYFELIEQM